MGTEEMAKGTGRNGQGKGVRPVVFGIAPRRRPAKLAAATRGLCAVWWLLDEIAVD